MFAHSIHDIREEMEKMFLENVKEASYDEVIKVMCSIWCSKTQTYETEFPKAFDRLATHPFSYRFKEFIYKYRVENVQIKSTTEFLQPQFDERGNAYVEMIGKDNIGQGWQFKSLLKYRAKTGANYSWPVF